MIAKVLPRHGGGVGATRASSRRLMAYLLGPGDQASARAAGEPGTGPGNVHTEPRVVAAWEPNVARAWGEQAARVAWEDPQAAWAALAEMGREIGDAACAHLDRVRDGQGSNAVWHTVMAAHPTDGLLSDEQWAAVARRLMQETGLHRADNPVRWVAVRHGVNEAGADHIHVMAVLVRADGSKPSMHRDGLAAQRAARWAEAEFGLVPGRAREDARSPRGTRVRADTPSGRGEMAAAAKAGPPYPRPEGMSDELWARVCQEGQARGWTRQGKARAAVLSAAARAVSMDHLVQLVREQGYQVRLRHSTTEPGQVTGWSVVAPPLRDGGKGKAYRGSALGSDCTWPALSAHVGRLATARGTGVLGAGEGEAMIAREKLVAAGWAAELVDDVLVADRMLAAGVQDASALAYWMRDAFWQLAWTVEGQYRQHGVFTDAAYIYAAIAAGGGPPAPPAEVVEAMQRLHAQYDQVRTRLLQLKAEGAARDAEAEEIEARSDDWDAWADGLAAQARPHMPYYLMLPGGQRMTGAAWVGCSLAAADMRTAAAAMRQAGAVHRAHSARMDQLTAAEVSARAEQRELGAWITQAKEYEGYLRDRLEAHTEARTLWRESIGRLLIDARAVGDTEAADRIAAMDARWGPGAAEGGLSLAAAAR